jgi:hypothetical protein
MIADGAKHHFLSCECTGHRPCVQYIAGYNAKQRMLNVDGSGIPDSCRDLMVLCESALKQAATHSSACADD